MFLLYLMNLQQAMAETGLVVRLHMKPPSSEETEGDTSVVKIQFGTPTGQLTELMLNDQGRRPDVNAGDGIYQGATMLSPETLTVAIVVGETQYSVGDFELINDGTPKDLDIQQEDDGFSLQISSGLAHSINPDGEPNEQIQGGDPAEQVLVNGMESVAGDIAIGTQELPPVEGQTADQPIAQSTDQMTNPTPSQTMSTPKPVTTTQSTSSGNSNTSLPLLPLIGGLFLLAAFGLFVLQRIQSLQVEMKGIERLKTYLPLGGEDIDLASHQRIVISAESYKEGFEYLIKTILNHRPTLICGEIPALRLHQGIAYTSNSFDAMQIGDQVEQLKKRHPDLCLCIAFSDDSTYSDFIDALPQNTDMIWLTKKSSKANYEMYKDSDWKLRTPEKEQNTEKNDAQNIEE
jgi:hypothetical protein